MNWKWICARQGSKCRIDEENGFAQGRDPDKVARFENLRYPMDLRVAGIPLRLQYTDGYAQGRDPTEIAVGPKNSWMDCTSAIAQPEEFRN